MGASGYVPITQVWGQNGLSAVTFASLEDAGFHPLTDCDLRGWMHYYGWPLGSQRPVTIWVPVAEHEQAAQFLDAPVEPAWSDEEFVADLWSLASENRRLIYLLWLLGFPAFGV